MTSISFREQTLQNCSIFLKEPLNLLHHRIVTLFDDMPLSSKVKEIALKVLFLVTLPISYLVASFLSLTGHLIDFYCFDSSVKDNHESLDNNFESSPYYGDLKSMIESRPISKPDQSAKILFNKEPRDADDEVCAIFSSSSNYRPGFSDLMTNNQYLERSSSIEELVRYTKSDFDDELETINACKPPSPQFIAFHPKSEFKVPFAESKALLLSLGKVEYNVCREGVTHVPKSDNLFTKFHALAAIQFLSKHFTKSCKAWDKREENLSGVSDFFAEIQKKSIKVAQDISPNAALILPEAFDHEELIPDLFKDFEFDAIHNHRLLEISSSYQRQFAEFTTHLFTPLVDGGKPFSLVVFEDNSAISYLAVDLDRAFLFDSTSPHFTVVDMAGSITSILEKIDNTLEPKKVKCYFGALKTDI